MPYMHAGRFTAQTNHPFVVFLIGMRINTWWRVDKWLPVAQAMGPMLHTLRTNPDKGLLHVEYFANLRGPLLVQYWRSFDALEAFAKDPADPHHAPWRAFNHAVGASGIVGIWHETYLVEPHKYECVYGNMPRVGLGAAHTHIPAVGQRNAARTRLSANQWDQRTTQCIRHT